MQGVANRVNALNAVDPSSFVAPAHALQAQAAARANNLGGGNANFQTAADVARGVASGAWLDARMAAPMAQVMDGGFVDAAQIGDSFSVGAAPTVRGESVLDNLGAYMSPYTQDVVDSTLTDFDVNAGRTRAQQDLELAGSGAFGGSGAALTKSMTEGELARARASAAATLRDQAFQRGAALSGDDAGRRQDAATLNAQLEFQRNTLNAQLGQERAIQNAQLAQGRNIQNAQMAQERGIQNAQLQQQDWIARTNATMSGQDQRLRAGEALANLTASQDQNARANIAAQAELGGALRDIDQQQRQAPLMTATQLSAALGGLPLHMFANEQTSTSQNSRDVSDTRNSQVSGSDSNSTNSSVTDATGSSTSRTKSSQFSISG